MTYVTSDWDFWELLWPQVFRGIGLMFAIMPVTNTALGTLPTGTREERLRPVQPDAQSRRRDRACRDQHLRSTTAWICISRACMRR